MDGTAYSAMMVPLRRYYQEALANGEIGTGGYTKSTGNCSGPVYYKKWVSCKSGGTEECYPSDC